MRHLAWRDTVVDLLGLLRQVLQSHDGVCLTMEDGSVRLLHQLHEH